MSEIGNFYRMRLLVRIFWVCALTLSTLAVSNFAVVPFASADDDGGGGGGGDGAGGGGGGDPWSPRFRAASRKKATCLCLPFAGCSCATKNAKRTVKRTGPNNNAPKAADSARRIELLVSNLPADAVTALQRRGFLLRGERRSLLVGVSLTRLVAPSGDSVRSASRRVRQLAPGSQVEANHAYRRLALQYQTAGKPCGRDCEPFKLTAWTERVGQCSAGTKIGVVDTGVDLTHPAIAGSNVKTTTTRSADHKPSDRDHGTAVVSLLVGREGSEVSGLAPSAEIFAADAFHGGPSGSIADTFDLIAALDWLVDQNVNTINLSLTGTDNPFIKRAIGEAIARNVTIVAAAGQPNESKSNGYPARYDGVIAVSSVDTRLRPSRLSNRGGHIAFAAPGVGITVANSDSQTKLADGTSFAAPFVTAAYAALLKSGGTTASVTEQLAATAKDLGSVGRDPVFGWGLVQFDAVPECR